MSRQREFTSPCNGVCLKKGPLLQKLLGIVSIIDNHATDYRHVKKWSNRINRIALILQPSGRKTSRSVEKRLRQYLQDIEKTVQTSQDRHILDNIMRYTNGFSTGLFTCYDYPFLPRTNNDLELFIRKMKTSHRRTTGLRSWNRYISRHGAYAAFAYDLHSFEDALRRVTTASEQAYHDQRINWEPKKLNQIKQKRFRKNPDQYLSDLEKKWIRRLL